MDEGEQDGDEEDEGGGQEEEEEAAGTGSSTSQPLLAFLPRFAQALKEGTSSSPVTVKTATATYTTILDLTSIALDNAVEPLRSLEDGVAACQAALASPVIGPLLSTRQRKLLEERIAALTALAQEFSSPIRRVPERPAALSPELEGFLEAHCSALTPPPTKLMQVEQVRSDVER